MAGNWHRERFNPKHGNPTWRGRNLRSQSCQEATRRHAQSPTFGCHSSFRHEDIDERQAFYHSERNQQPSNYRSCSYDQYEDSDYLDFGVSTSHRRQGGGRFLDQYDRYGNHDRHDNHSRGNQYKDECDERFETRHSETYQRGRFEISSGSRKKQTTSRPNKGTSNLQRNLQLPRKTTDQPVVKQSSPKVNLQSRTGCFSSPKRSPAKFMNSPKGETSKIVLNKVHSLARTPKRGAISKPGDKYIRKPCTASPNQHMVALSIAEGEALQSLNSPLKPNARGNALQETPPHVNAERTTTSITRKMEPAVAASSLFDENMDIHLEESIEISTSEKEDRRVQSTPHNQELPTKFGEENNANLEEMNLDISDESSNVIENMKHLKENTANTFKTSLNNSEESKQVIEHIEDKGKSDTKTEEINLKHLKERSYAGEDDRNDLPVLKGNEVTSVSRKDASPTGNDLKADKDFQKRGDNVEGLSTTEVDLAFGMEENKDSAIASIESGLKTKLTLEEKVGENDSRKQNNGATKSGTCVKKGCADGYTAEMSELDDILVLHGNDDDNGDDDEDDDDDDDGMFLKAPAFLKSIDDIINRPLPGTPSKSPAILDSSQESPTCNINQVIVDTAKESKKKYKYTLENLLVSHEEKVELGRQHAENEKELQADIDAGSFTQLSHSQQLPEEIPDEQMKVLDKFDVNVSKIATERPGVVVFHEDQYLSCFDADLHPTHCGFHAGNGLYVERHIESITTDKYKRLVNSNLLTLCFSKIACQQQLNKWIFFLMSVHSDCAVQRSCLNFLRQLIQQQQEAAGRSKWGPSLSDIVTVFLNYGAELDSILPCGYASNTLRKEVFHQPNMNNNKSNEVKALNIRTHLEHVLGIVTLALKENCCKFCGEDLTALVYLLVKASLDTHFTEQCLFLPFQLCVGQAIDAYTQSDWRKQRLPLCRLLTKLTNQHHDASHVTDLLSLDTERGQYMCRHVSFLTLQKYVTDSTPTDDEDDLSNLEIKDLAQFIPSAQDLLQSDPYKLSSIIKVLDRCVGPNIDLSPDEREQLKMLLGMLQRTRVKDDVSQLDRSEVKDMIDRLTSRWTFDIQATKSKQTRIFELSSPMRMATVNLTSKNDSDSDEETSMPSKIPRIDGPNEKQLRE